MQCHMMVGSWPIMLNIPHSDGAGQVKAGLGTGSSRCSEVDSSAVKSSLVVGAVEFDREYLVQGSQCTLAVAP